MTFRTRLLLFFALPAALCAGSTSSCSGAIGFAIERDIAEQTVMGNPVAHAAGTVLGGAPINPFALDIDVASEARANNSAPVSRVFLRALSFTITQTAQPAGDTDCFDFVDSVTLQVESTRAGTSLQPAVIAEGSRPGCVQTFALTVHGDVNLKPYIDEGLRVTTSGRGITPADDVSFNGHVTLRAEPF